MLPQMPHFFDFIHVRSVRDLPHLGLVLLLTGGIILGVYLALQPQIFNKQAAEGTLVDLKFAPESLQIQAGKVYEAKIAINPKKERVTALQLYVGYDPAIVTILETKNEGFLPVTLKAEDNFQGTLNLTYGSTIESQATKPGMVATIKFKVNTAQVSELSIKGNSQVNVSSKEGNVLTSYSKLPLQVAEEGTTTGEEDTRYPDSLLLEKAFTPDSSPFIRDFQEAMEPKPDFGTPRVKPGFSEAYILQLGRDVFVDPIVALNDVLEEKATEILKPE